MNFLFGFSAGFLDSSLQIHLDEYELNQIFISLCFVLEASIYLALCLIAGNIIKIFDERYLMITGCLAFTLAYLFLGPWTLIFPDSLVFVILSLPLFSIGMCFTYSNI
jgi:hypothetical protein